MAENLKIIHRHARQSLKAAQMRQKIDYDMRMLEHIYNIGDFIFLRDSSTKIGLNKKLKPNPVFLLTVEFKAIASRGIFLSHALFLFSIKLRIIAKTMVLYLSTCPFEDGL
jgi:hypothetical protein